MSKRKLTIKGDTTYITETVSSFLFQNEVEIELPEGCELRNADKPGKYKIVITEEKKEIKTKEDIIALDAAMDQLEEKAIEVATYLGYIDDVWDFEDMRICAGNETITVTSYDALYDLHDTKCVTFPMECILSEEFLKDYKIKHDEWIRMREEQVKQKKLQAEEARERAEYERLKVKFEG